MLSDEDHAVAEAYGAWGEKKNYGRVYEGLIRSTVWWMKMATSTSHNTRATRATSTNCVATWAGNRRMIQLGIRCEWAKHYSVTTTDERAWRNW